MKKFLQNVLIFLLQVLPVQICVKKREGGREKGKKYFFDLTYLTFVLYPTKTEMGTVKGKGAGQNFPAMGGTSIYTTSNLTIV